jgi:hypothetical protein
MSNATLGFRLLHLLAFVDRWILAPCSRDAFGSAHRTETDEAHNVQRFGCALVVEQRSFSAASELNQLHAHQASRYSDSPRTVTSVSESLMAAHTRSLGAPLGTRGAIDNANDATPWTPQIAAVAHPFEEGFHRRAAALGAWHANQLRPFHQDNPWPQNRERPARSEECNRAGRCGHTAMAWSATRPLASARPPHGIRRSTCNASVSMCRDSQARATWRPPVTGPAALSLAGERFRDDRRARTGAGCLWSRQTAPGRGGEVHPQGQQQDWGPSGSRACAGRKPGE